MTKKNQKNVKNGWKIWKSGIISQKSFFSTTKKLKRRKTSLKNAFLLVFQYKEDAIWPELSSPARFRIQGWYPAIQRSKSTCWWLDWDEVWNRRCCSGVQSIVGPLWSIMSIEMLSQEITSGESLNVKERCIVVSLHYEIVWLLYLLCG